MAFVFYVQVFLLDFSRAYWPYKKYCDIIVTYLEFYLSVNVQNTIFIYLFTALASGGAVVISQYLGSRDEKNTTESSSQLLMFSTWFSIILAVLVLIFNRGLLRLLFGSVENSVMEACITYLRISAYSFPALAIYNAGASLYRSMGKTDVTMYISIISRN